MMKYVTTMLLKTDEIIRKVKAEEAKEKNENPTKSSNSARGE
jgi:hypothetical protein